MVPAVTEVVLVPELVALRVEELVEADVVLQQALVSLVEVEARDEVRRSVVTSGAEPVQVAVGPTHRGLDHVVQPGQGQVAGQVEAPPHRRLRAVQVQAHPEPANLGRDREQRRRLVALELLEDAGHLPAHQRVEQRSVLLGAGSRHQLLHQMLDVGRFGHAG